MGVREIVDPQVDIVVTWVDGSDPKWLQERAKYREVGDSRMSRFRDWGTLRYWFRGVEAFAPWVRTIHFVTAGHVPLWLNLSHPRLHVVRHDEFIPERFLPTFSCRPIEFNLHRIDDLSEQFVYFNDDMFLLRPTSEKDFFVRGLPCDSALLDAVTVSAQDGSGNPLDLSSIYSSLITNTAIINRNFDKWRAVSENYEKWFSPFYGLQLYRNCALLPWHGFTGFKNAHAAYSLLKSTYREVWARERDVLEIACEHKFRNSGDVSSRLLSYWQIAEGRFYPRSPRFGSLVSLTDSPKSNEVVFSEIREARQHVLCVNDEFSNGDFAQTKRELAAAFESLLPIPSSYER